MPHLDAMLRALAERGARELRLSESRRPVFVFGEGEKFVSQTVLKRPQIVSLLSELSPNGLAAKIAAGEAVSFRYRLPEGKTFSCEVFSADSGLAARIRPSDDTEAAAVDDSSAPHAEEPKSPPEAGLAPARFDPTRSRPGAPGVEAYLGYMIEAGASDLHLCADAPPLLRVEGELVRIEGAETLTPDETSRLLLPMMPERCREEFEATSDTDFAYEIPGVARFRCNVFADRNGMGAAFRAIPGTLPAAEELGLSDAILDLCRLSSGLVLVSGHAGSGRSTTLAALVDHINRNRAAHILVIENSIEFAHASERSIVNQREIGTHTGSLARALDAALREDPDVLVLGCEMEGPDTVKAALDAAETGRLVLGTLRAPTTTSALGKLIDPFPADRQVQIRALLSECFRGAISQTLLRKKGGGRTAAFEVLLGAPAVSTLIREGKTFQIPSILQASRKQGMVLMNDALLDLVRRDLVAPADACSGSPDRAGLVAALKSAGLQASTSPGL